ncbi:MAG: hypothetical protein HQ534_02270 [Armatimonadetes bacterium]|nr:hypothetical protein [Armatimonadota bacterium]
MIIIAGIICTLLLVTVFFFLFLNRGNDSIVPILFKVFAAVLAAAAILIIDLSKTPETLHLKTNFLILRNENGELLKLTPVTSALNLPPWHAYNLLDYIWLFRGYKPQTEPFIMDQYIFNELLFAAFLKWMANHYFLHWEMKYNYIYGISGGGGHSSPKEGRDKKFETYRFVNSSNGFLVHDPVYNEFQFPKGSKTNLSKTKLETVFTITNPHMTFTFKSLYLGNSGISYTILGDKIDKHLKVPDSFYAQNYIITLDATFSRFLRWSPKTNKQKEWVNQIFKNIERDFNWDTFKNQLHDGIDGLPKDKILRGIPLKIIQDKDTHS